MALVLGLGALLVAWNTAVNLRPLPRWTYVPLNLTVAAILVAAARLTGQTWEELALDPSGLVAGLGWGLVAVVMVAAGMAAARSVAVVVAPLRALLKDRRAADLSPTRLAYDTLVRIPLGTAVGEEVLFRGVLFAALLDVAPVMAAVAGSSVLFGLWHVGPTLAALRENEAAFSLGQRVLVVIGAVVATTAGGVVFSLLRLGTGSLTTPVFTHWAINGTALFAAHSYSKRSTRSARSRFRAAATSSARGRARSPG